MNETVENFEAIVQGKASFPNNNDSASNYSNDSSSNPSTPVKNNEVKKKQNLKTPVNGQNTLFQHGFNISDEKKNTDSAATKTKGINPYPSKADQDDYVKKHGEDKFVSGIGFNLVQVEPGTFAAMDAKEEASNKSPSQSGSEEENGEEKTPDQENKEVTIETKESEESKKSPETSSVAVSASVNDDHTPKTNSSETGGNEKKNTDSVKEDMIGSSAGAAPTDDIEFPPNDDNLEEQKDKRTKKKRAKRTGALSKGPQRISFDTSTAHINDDLSEDSRNTINSNQASFNISQEEGRRHVPPHFIRYRVGIILDKEDRLLQSDSENNKLVTPTDRFRAIFIDLATCVNKLDKDSLFISWKIAPTFKASSTDPSAFPTRIEEIATFFNGYKAKLREGVKKFFQFCIHSPKLTDSTLESKLVEWGRVHSYNLYECNLQAESSKTIGWLVYSMPFTNVNYLKKYMKLLSGHEWGFKYTAFTNSDKSMDWKVRLKALEIMVPAEVENSAQSLVSNTFKQWPSLNTYKSFSECYIYVGNEREDKEENLATIFLEMVGRHRFQLAYLNFVPVSFILKGIDKKLSTRDKKVNLTIREMILNLVSRDTRYGKQKLFQTVDFVPDPTKVWFNKVKGEGTACYYLSYYKWAKGEAQHTAEGLGAYLGQKFGHSAIFPHFTADHWLLVKEWKWNTQKKRFDTPQEMNLAESVMFDPITNIMKKVQEEKQELEDIQETANTEEVPEPTQPVITNNSDVNELNNREETVPTAAPYVYDGNTATSALSIAQSIQSASSMSSSSSALLASLSQLALERAAEVVQGQQDPDYNSICHSNRSSNDVHQVVPNDNQAITTSMTDITNNTVNREYHYEFKEDASVTSCDTSLTLQSFNNAELNKVINTSMSTEEMEAVLSNAIKENIRKNQRKANMFLAKVLKEQRSKSSQSDSNCDAAQEK